LHTGLSGLERHEEITPFPASRLVNRDHVEVARVGLAIIELTVASNDRSLLEGRIAENQRLAFVDIGTGGGRQRCEVRESVAIVGQCGRACQ
jgi:hypothetical protein